MSIGNPDSRYTYCPEQLQKDVEEKNNEHRSFIDTVKSMVISEPAKMDLRYKDLIEALRELKTEYSL